MKRVLIVVGIVLVVVVGGGAILLSNLDKVVAGKKDYILAQAQSRLGRSVAVDAIDVGLWPGVGVSLSNVTIADDPSFSPDPFVRVADLRVNVKLLPLLRKKVEVKRLVLREPFVTVIVDESGRRNFDGLAAAGEGAGAAGDSAGRESPGAAAAAFVLAYADVEDARVRFVDRAKGIDHTVKAIDFTARNVSLDDEISFELSAGLVSEEADLRVEGKAGPVGEFASTDDLADVPVDVKVELGPVDAASVRAAFPKKPELAKLDALGLGAVDATLALRGALGDLRLEDLVAHAALFGAKEANATLRASVSGIRPLAAPFDAAALVVKGDVAVGPAPLAALSSALPKKGGQEPPWELDGTAAAECAFEGPLGAMQVRGTIDAAAASIRMGETFRKPAGVEMGAAINGEYRTPALHLSGSEIRFHNLRAALEGSLGTEGYDVTLASGDTDVSPWRDLVPALAALSPTGAFAVRARATGSPAAGSSPQVEGTLAVKGVGAKLAQLPEPVHDATATVKFTTTSVQIDDASFAIGKSVIRAKLDATQLEPLRATYRVTSDRVWRGDVQAPVGKPSPRAEVLDRIVADGRVWRDVPERVDHEGTVTSASGIIANLDYTDMRATIHSEGDAIVIDAFTANLLDGTVEGNGRVAPTAVPPSFDIKTRVRQVDVAKYLALKFPTLANLIEGRIDVDMNVAGAGKTWDQIAATLRGGGDAIVVRGALLNLNLASELVAGLETIPLVPPGFADRLRARNPKLFAGNTTAFENLKGALTIDNGRVNAGGLVLTAADFSISGDGWFSFERTLDLASTVVFSQKLSNDIVGELPVARYLLDAEGRIALPLTLSGDALKPKIGLDTNALGAKFRQSAVDQGRDQLKDQVKEGVKDLLGGFGKKKSGGEAPPDTSGTRKNP